MAMFQGNKNQPRKKNIFISYREKDTAGETGRLVDMLKQYFYEDQIFMDIDKIEPGVDFTDVINNSLEACDVMLAVIGPNWTAKNATNSTARINDSNDWVRLEIATALERKIRVVPVLVDGGTLPPGEELPEDLQPLLKRQAYEISNKRWRYDTENLVAFLEKSVGIPTRQTKVTTPVKTSSSTVGSIIKYGLIGLGALFVILVIYYMGAGNAAKTNTVNDNNNSLYNKPSTQDNTNTTTDPTPTNNTENEVMQQPVDEPKTQVANVAGIWDDANGLYYLDIVQNGNQVELYSYSIAGQQTGAGVGTVNGRNFSFKITVVNAGILSAETKLSANNFALQGFLNIENNGAKYSEPLTLNKRSSGN